MNDLCVIKNQLSLLRTKEYSFDTNARYNGGDGRDFDTRFSRAFKQLALTHGVNLKRNIINIIFLVP